MSKVVWGLVIGATCALALSAVAEEPSREESLGPLAVQARQRFDLAEVQGIMAVQRLDGWLLYDLGGLNPIALEVVAPAGPVTRRWFYLIPAKGDPVALVPRMEASAFAGVTGRKIEYATWRELEAGLKQLLKGRRRVAMEYSPGGALPWFSRVDAGTVEQVEGLGVDVVSSAELVQTAKTRWGKDGRASHYLAAHHLNALKDDAFAWIAAEVRAGRKPTEWDVQQRLWKSFATRGLAAEHAPVVASNQNAANPRYRPDKATARAIGAGDLVVIELGARSAGQPLSIYAEITWVGYVGESVPARFAEPFAVVVAARDATVAFVADKVKSRKPVRGFEADQIARGVVDKAGHGDRFIHRTGHSLDTSLLGDGAHLDDYETHDVRTLVQGSGFTIEPGIYFPGEFGVRSEIDCYVGTGGLEVTTEQQKEIVPILRK